MPTLSEVEDVGALRSEPSPKWVRARIGGTMVADSRRARLVFVGARARAYAFPLADVRRDLVTEAREPREDSAFGRVREADLRVGDRREGRAVVTLEPTDAEAANLVEHVIVRWGAVDSWYEEDEEVFVHPRDPHHRIDVVQSSRHVVVELDGERLAESRRPVLLFETGLPVRYYLPQTDVRLDLLRESDTSTACPYKGFASYHDVVVNGSTHEDLVWTYRAPFPEAQKVMGLRCFFNERVDLTVDDEQQERPRTQWSSGVR